MSERGGGAVGELTRAVTAVLAEDPVDLPAPVALQRARALIVTRERLEVALLAAVDDVDRRELFTLDHAGSTRGWLRTQPGGDAGQLGRARRLRTRPHVRHAQAMGEISGRAANELCGALDKVPDDVPTDRLIAVLVDGIQDHLAIALGRTKAEHVPPTPDQLALRAELASTVGDALADDTASPAQRLETPFLLLAQHVAPGQLAWTLGRLLDALLPDGIDQPDPRDFSLDLTPVLNGEWDLRGHLDHATGLLLQTELDRQRRAADHAAAEAARVAARQAQDRRAAGEDVPVPAEPLFGTDREPSAYDHVAGDPHATAAPTLRTQGHRRHDELGQLLRDAADLDAGTGQAAPAAITIVATLDAVEGRAGALPGLLLTPGQPVSLSPETLQRHGCWSEITAVLLDALGRPVATSTTRRSADRRQRAALLAQWGPWCAIAGCTSTDTVPHHVEPWWKSRQTVLKDLLPLCTNDHRDLHEGHRTLRLKDGRLIDENGWADEDTLAAA